MKLISQFIPVAQVDADWLLVGLWEKNGLDANIAALDARLGGVLSRLKDSGDITGKAKELTPILDVRGIGAKRVLAVGLGSKTKIDFAGLVGVAGAAAPLANKQVPGPGGACSAGKSVRN